MNDDALFATAAVSPSATQPGQAGQPGAAGQRGRSTGLAYDERMTLHCEDADSPHPERPDRIRAVIARLQSAGLAGAPAPLLEEIQCLRWCCPSSARTFYPAALLRSNLGIVALIMRHVCSSQALQLLYCPAKMRVLKEEDGVPRRVKSGLARQSTGVTWRVGSRSAALGA